VRTFSYIYIYVYIQIYIYVYIYIYMHVCLPIAEYGLSTRKHASHTTTLQHTATHWDTLQHTAVTGCRQSTRPHACIPHAAAAAFTGLFCKISSLLYGSFAKEIYIFLHAAAAGQWPWRHATDGINFQKSAHYKIYCGKSLWGGCD